MLRGTARPDASVPWPSGPLAAALASRIIDMLALSRIPGNDARAQPCNRPEGSRSLEFLVDGMRSSCARLRATAWRSRESSASLSCEPLLSPAGRRAHFLPPAELIGIDVGLALDARSSSAVKLMPEPVSIAWALDIEPQHAGR